MIGIAARDGVRFTNPEAGTIEVSWQARRMKLKLLDRGVEAALLALPSGPVSQETLFSTAGAAGGSGERLDQEIRRLAERQAVQYCLSADGEIVAEATPMGGRTGYEFAAVPPDQWVRLSRHVALHGSGDDLVADAPAAHGQVRIRAPEAAVLIARAVRASRADALARRAFRSGTGLELITFLVGTGVLEITGQDGTAEGERPELRQRELPDMLLHARSRFGLSDEPIGGTFPFVGQLDPAPAIRNSGWGRPLALPRPGRSSPGAAITSLADVMERRRSIRRHGEPPITLDQLGEFLYRVASVKSVAPIDEAAGHVYETSERPYPSGGAAYDLEFYITVSRCTGLDPGIYYYHPLDHELSLVTDDLPLLNAMLRSAYLACGQESVPQVLVTLASRFTRLSWKYQGIAYTTTLKNVGVLYEAMYLVATAMGLAPCALGSGDSAAFWKATGLDPIAESSVGEFMLGSALSGAGDGDPPAVAEHQEKE
jgi:oxazoline/thiazoline dehydrogenase